MKFLEYIKGCQTALIISSRPLDFDCIGSSLILKKYLESLNLKVELMFPTKMSDEEKKFNDFLPYFSEIKDADTREVLNKRNFDLLILVDGANLVQFYDTTESSESPPDLSIYPKRIHIDHHQSPDTLGNLTIHDKTASSTVEVILTKIVPLSFLDQKLATLGYAAIVGDTGNFSWQFSSKTLQLASQLLEKGARADEIIYQMNSKPKLYFEMFKYTLDNLVYDDKLKTVFMFLPFEKIQQDNIDEEKLDNIRQVFNGPISKSLTGYPRSFFLYERTKNLVSITSRGNNFTNKISLPELIQSLGGNGGGHFNAAGGKVGADFESVRENLLKGLETKI